MSFACSALDVQLSAGSVLQSGQIVAKAATQYPLLFEETGWTLSRGPSFDSALAVLPTKAKQSLVAVLLTRVVSHFDLQSALEEVPADLASLSPLYHKRNCHFGPKLAHE